MGETDKDGQREDHGTLREDETSCSRALDATTDAGFVTQRVPDRILGTLPVAQGRAVRSMKMYDVFAKSLAVIRNGIAEILARTSSKELFE